jgi:hypothetical protein
MKTRFILLILGLAFVVTLAVIVGQRLSAEAMAVMVGVVAGVAVSIPTSLLVVWFANRALMVSRPMPEMPAPAYAPRSMPVAPEPQQIVVMAPSNAYPNMSSYPTQAAPAYSLPTAPVSRQFTVIGGVETPAENSEVA